LAIPTGDAEERNSPTAAEELCNWVLTTSRGLVMQEASVPAIPPERRLRSFMLVDVMVLVAMAVEPPRGGEDPPRV
jgi:hypothetical protein